MDSVLDILENTKVHGDYHTHVSMVQPLGKFQISRNNMENFWENYCSDIIENEEKAIYGIAEKLQTYIPVLVDVDIKLPYSEDKDTTKLYTDHQIDSIVRDYQETLKNIITDCQPTHLICFVLEKPAYKIESGDSEFIKNGFHLHFPYTFLSKNDHEAHLVPRVKKLIDKSNVFKNLGIGKPGDLIDACYTRNPWLLYGSRKGERMDPYVLTRILDQDREEIGIKQALADYKIFDADEIEIPINGRFDFFLPRILSVIPWCRPVCDIKPNLPSMIKISVGPEKVKRDYVVKNMTETMEKAKKFIAVMSDHRAESYSDWMQIGWALYNISNGSEDGMMMWLEFSTRCGEKFDEAHCMATWSKMEHRNMTIGTLAHFAKEDNRIEYEKIVRSYSDEYINQSLTGSHHDLAKACFERYGNEFVCASIVQNLWYQYDAHKWKRIEEGVFLRQKLSEEFVTTFSDKGKEIFGRMSGCPDGDKDMYAAQQKQVQKMVNNLKQSPFKSNVMKECKEVFYNENFLKQLDKNPWLIAFRNGVYDLKANMFRPGIPEDYLSLQMPIEYSEYQESDKLVQEVYTFFEKIFPDREVRDYFMDVASEVFVGGNRKKHVYFWSGEGDNGKSVTELFFEKMLGEYAVKLPTSLIVGKRTQSSAACPELVRAGNGVRWAILQEPDKKDIINIGILKELSGNDSFFARGLFQAGGEIEPMFKLTVICNDPPSIPYSDKATWNRIRVIPFESTFSSDAPTDYDEQLRTKVFPKDPFFAEKIPSLIKPFAWVLLNHRKKGVKLVDPAKVTLATDGYRKKNDTYRQFVDERIITAANARINLAELYTSFKEWFKESVPGQQLPTKSEVKEYYTKLWGEPERGGVWKGRRSMTYEDQVEKGDILLLTEEDLS
jgi:P4 family phage/plasmid primase-like protien